MSLVTCPNCGAKMDAPARCLRCGNALVLIREHRREHAEEDPRDGHVLLGSIIGAISPWAVGIVWFGAKGAIGAWQPGSVLASAFISAVHGVFNQNWHVLTLFSLVGAVVGFLLASWGFRTAPVAASRVVMWLMVGLALAVGPFGLVVLMRIIGRIFRAGG